MTTARWLRPARPVPRRVAPLAEAIGLRLVGDAAEVEATGVCERSGDVEPGDVFVAAPGRHSHGADHLAEAAGRGAVAVLTEPAVVDTVTAHGLPALVSDHPRAASGPLAALVYGQPGDQLTTYAVTGTNGKTTTTYYLDAMARLLGRATGLIGTVQTRVLDEAVDSVLTTPQAPDVQAALAAMVERGVRSLVMEVSSHALALGRVDGLVFDLAAFTNLSQDHLDFHGTMDAYLAAKAELFTPARSRRGVVMVDDEWGARMAGLSRVPTATVSMGGGPAADWTVGGVAASGELTGFVVEHRDGRAIRMAIEAPGTFNVANAALAAVMLVESGVDAAVLDRAIRDAGGLRVVVPGRMETLATAPRVVVDFAHNPDALRLAMDALRPRTSGRLIVVFGATGDRDRGKRPLMGAVAVAHADLVVVTDDDPHEEDAAAIRAEVLAGTADAAPGQVVELAPRERAIAMAVAAAAEEDTVLIAGRGHELVQEIGTTAHPLDDRAEAASALLARSGGGGTR